jgi:hypothetical protein
MPPLRRRETGEGFFYAWGGPGGQKRRLQPLGGFFYLFKPTQFVIILTRISAGVGTLLRLTYQTNLKNGRRA